MCLLSSLESFQTSVTFLCEGEIRSCVELLERTNRAIRKVSGWQQSKGCLLSQRMPCLAVCCSPGWEVRSCDSITGFPRGLPSCSLLPASPPVLLALSSWVWASSLHFCWFCFLAVCFLVFSFQNYSNTTVPIFLREERQCSLIKILGVGFHWKKLKYNSSCFS